MKQKIIIPMFEVGELEQFDIRTPEIVEKYSKMILKEREQILTQRIIKNQAKEIEILQDCLKIEKERIKKENYIINELEKYIEFYVSGNPIYDEKTTQVIWNKLKSLKEGITNETNN